MEVAASITPNSNEFGVEWDTKRKRLRVRLVSDAEQNRANQELVMELSRVLGCEVRIVRGWKSRSKRLLVDCDEVEIQRRVAPAKEGADVRQAHEGAR